MEAKCAFLLSCGGRGRISFELRRAGAYFQGVVVPYFPSDNEEQEEKDTCRRGVLVLVLVLGVLFCCFTVSLVFVHCSFAAVSRGHRG